ncbi:MULTISPECIES: ROK family protein [unclassified Cryobacterium]|uniref:ROK family protein n=1 Tax=unclassified Cryobacterium TaxID=2649013 RepID=UPI00106C0D42|nr:MULTISPECIES: ROK family protein [unclassified Cryobacterium]TFC59501.1 ROK family protein [Cryobacterium sp. TMB3-1-2]TFC67297.1 ROK family protein [Cryobacterium sp. TMB3-15]TFC73190.1 ROK family protein [Cryobacterium sp. TMB3-10]TFC85381.1 ROK family protein [Cryobacterium sp. TMT4-31]TFD46078.1 ROK family protein [Cryobacterium sp. TMB3-12]
MGDFNAAVVLDAIRRSVNGLSRVELGHSTGLSAQTVSNICRRLIDRDMVLEAGKASSGPGKPRTILKLNPGGVYAVGVHLDPAVMTFAILDLTGAVVHRSRSATPAASDPDHVVRHIAEEIERLIREAGVDRAKIAGLGVATPGPIDPERGTVVDPPHLLGWHLVPLRDALAQATGFEVIVDKDVTAAAVAEMWAGGPSGVGSFVFFYLGTGIGAGLVLRDEVVRGSSHNSGEIGHIIVDPDGPPCGCGLRGCVAVTCTPQSLVRAAVRLGVLTASKPNADARETDVQFSALCELAEGGSDAALAVLEQSAGRVAKAVSVLTNLLDVDRVVFGGPYWSRLSRVYLRRIPGLLDELTVARSIHRIEVAGTGVGEDVGAVGAACLVLDHTLAPRAARLILG